MEICLDMGVFPDSAQVICLKKDTYVDIVIKAFHCDGIIECKNGVDEQNCAQPDYVLIVTLVIVIVICCILAYLGWKCTRVK